MLFARILFVVTLIVAATVSAGAQIEWDCDDITDKSVSGTLLLAYAIAVNQEIDNVMIGGNATLGDWIRFPVLQCFTVDEAALEGWRFTMYATTNPDIMAEIGQLLSGEFILGDMADTTDDSEPAEPVTDEPAAEEALTARSPIWDAPDGEEELVLLVQADDPSCYSYIEWGIDANRRDTIAERMGWRQKFINKCIGGEYPEDPQQAPGEPADSTERLTVKSPVWDDPAGEEALVIMVVSNDASCYSYIEWGIDAKKRDTIAERMGWRQKFINKCIGN
ncbi:MAG: hypothetical protein OXG53_09625 [Chloroflexi bacterium]|nr:hypothetical protein [Chloroflexota bacterium]